MISGFLTTRFVYWKKTIDVKTTVFGMKVHVSGTHLFCGGQEGTNPMKGWWITASDTVPVLRSAFANHLYDEGRFPLLHDWGWKLASQDLKSSMKNALMIIDDHHFTIKAAIFRAPTCDIKTPSTRPGVVCLDSLAPDWTRWNHPWRGHFPPVVGAVDAAKNQWDQVGSRDLQWYIIFIIYICNIYISNLTVYIYI